MYYEKSKQDVIFDRNQLQMICVDDLVPEDHLLRRIENIVDFSFIYKLTKEYYSQDNGRPCLDTVILFKIILLNFLMGKNSIRATLEETKVNLAYRWFLGLGVTSLVPNHSTFSQNYIRRYSGTKVFEKIFSVIVTKIIEAGLADPSIVFVDGTHIKANANKHKSVKKQVRIVADQYQKELEKEVDEFRELNGRDKYHDDSNDDGMIDDKTGEIVEAKDDTKEITLSTTDPDAGMFVKGEHERQFAYVDQVACDRHGGILAFEVNPGNMHDSKAFLPFFEHKLAWLNPKTICCDAGYVSAYLAYQIQKHFINFLVPYVRPKGREQLFGKKQFDYYIEADSYLCPGRKELLPWNITKDGSIEYKIHKDECGACIDKPSCLKQYSFKTIRRHIYEDCLEQARAYRLTSEGKELYKLRKETIERVFAEGKEKHGLRFTRYKGREKNTDMRALLYACLNIKKLANHFKRFASLQDNMNLQMA